MRLLSSAVFAAATAFLWLTPVQANPVTFSYVGPACQYYCASGLGVPVGTPLDFKIYIDLSSLVPNAVITPAELLGFDASVGSFSLSAAQSVGIYFQAVVNSAGDGLLSYSWIIEAGDAILPDEGHILLARNDDWDVIVGGCTDNTCNSYGQDSYNDGAAVGFGYFVRDTPAPEPLTLSIFAAGLLGLGFRRRQHV